MPQRQGQADWPPAGPHLLRTEPFAALKPTGSVRAEGGGRRGGPAVLVGRDAGCEAVEHLLAEAQHGRSAATSNA